MRGSILFYHDLGPAVPEVPRVLRFQEAALAADIQRSGHPSSPGFLADPLCLVRTRLLCPPILDRHRYDPLRHSSPSACPIASSSISCSTAFHI